MQLSNGAGRGVGFLAEGGNNQHKTPRRASVAQLVEQLIRNQQAVSSNLTISPITR